MIKKAFFLLMFLMLYSACSNDNTDVQLKLLKEIIDIGKIKKSDKSIATFEIVNVGKNDMLVQNIKPACHCTVSDWPSDLVKPGDTIAIQLAYDNHKLGFFEQTASVYIKHAKEVPLLIMRGTIIQD